MPGCGADPGDVSVTTFSHGLLLWHDRTVRVRPCVELAHVYLRFAVIERALDFYGSVLAFDLEQHFRRGFTDRRGARCLR